jgi:hypothetical protein
MSKRSLVFLLCLINLIFFISCEKENTIHNEDVPIEATTASWSIIRDNYQMPEDFGSFYKLHIDNEDNIWLSSYYLKNGWTAGLWKHDGEQWIYEDAFENYYTGERNKVINGEIVFTGNDMWFGLNNHLVKFDGVNFNEYPYPKIIDGENDLKVLHLNGEDELWVVAGKYVATFKNNEWSEKFELPTDIWKYDLAVDNDTIWVSANGGLFKHYDTTTLHYTEIIASLGNNEYDTISTSRLFEIEKENGSRLFVSTLNGLLIRENGKWSVLNDQNSIIEETVVTAIARDKNNLIWVGTWDGFYTLDANNTLTKIPVPIRNYCSPCEGDEVLEIDVDSKNRKIIVSHANIILTLED